MIQFTLQTYWKVLAYKRRVHLEVFTPNSISAEAFVEAKEVDAVLISAVFPLVAGASLTGQAGTLDASHAG